MKEETQAEMIQRILGESGRWMNAASLEALTDMSHQSFYRAVSKLFYLGIVEKKKDGGLFAYRLRTEEPEKEAQIAGPRTHVNGSMPNGSHKWWAQFLANQMVVR